MNRLCPLVLLLFSIWPSLVNAQATVNWTGSISTDWNTAGNWSSGFVPGSGDNVQVGIVSFSNQPVVNTNVHIADLIFGGVSPVTLTVVPGAQLLVDHHIIQNHNLDYSPVTTTVTGGGGISCGAVFIGNYTTSKIVKDKTTTFISSIASFSVTDSLTIYSSTTDLLSGGIANDNSTFSLEGGTLSVGGFMKLDNQLPVYLAGLTGTRPLSKFVINITSNQDAILKIPNDSFFKIKNLDYAKIDFYNHVSGTGRAVVQYTGGNQSVYTNTTTWVDQAPYTYQDLRILGSGVKTAGTGSGTNALNVDGTLEVISGTLDLSANNVATTVSGNFTNRGAIKLGESTMVNGGTFFNSGQFNPGTGIFQFSGNNQQLTDSTGSVTNFYNVIFSKQGTKTIANGRFSVSPTAKVSLTDSVVVNVSAPALLTLRADSTGAAAITAIPASSSILGQVAVEQFIQGNAAIYRGYHYFSSSVNHTGNLKGERDFNLNYLIGTNDYNGVLTGGPGGPANGFTTTGCCSNPTMFLNREDRNYCQSSFYCGFGMGILKINNTNPNDISTMSRFSFSSIPDTVTQLPIGNGLYFYYIGNRIIKNNSTAGNKITITPYNLPESMVVSNTGTVNQGDVQVRSWYRPDKYISYTNNPSVDNRSNARGTCTVGNPYPCNINWDELNLTDSTQNIYGPNLLRIIYVYNVVTKQFNSYQADATHDRHSVYYGTGIASNMIAAGAGFQVQVDPNSPDPYHASLLFREGAKAVDPNVIVAPAVRLQSFKAVNTLALSGKASSITKADPLIRLRLVQDSENMDEVVMRFRSNTRARYNNQEDALDLGGSEEAKIMLSSYSSDHVPLDINWMPLPKKTTRILLFTNATMNGNYTLTASEIKDIPAWFKVLLRDKMTGKLINLRNRDAYRFSINKENAASYGDRFELILTK